jgi:hypothetical protein
MAPIKITGHATTRVTPTRMTISRPIDDRLMSVTTMSVTTMDLAALSGNPGADEIGRNPLASGVRVVGACSVGARYGRRSARLSIVTRGFKMTFATDSSFYW